MTVSEYAIPALRSRRVAFFAVVAGTVGWGGWTMARILGASGFTLLECIILALFVPIFGWISVSFWTGCTGFLLVAMRRDPLTLRRLSNPGPQIPALRAGSLLSARTAIVLPAFQEDPDALSATVSSLVRSLINAGAERAFHIHILSDSVSSTTGYREEQMWVRLQARHPEVPIFYRRREANTGRKAGNIAEFCSRCGDRYEYMVVLDADSIMTAATLVALVEGMDADPGLGLIQTVPIPALQTTPFGRLVQFAASLYGPVLAAGLSFWQGDAANYWGHNAIIRVAPFADHARLPVLRGRPPLGGELLSHDFVEAALLRRAGWKVILDANLGGSWEGLPGNLADFAARDRRWAQGSLQHLRLVLERGLHPLSRVHFTLGAMGYVSSLLWLLFLVAGTAYVLAPSMLDRPMGWGTPTPPRVSLLALTAAVLFLPKLLALALALSRSRAQYGGARRLLASGVVELSASVLLAPILMWRHATSVGAILVGRTVPWSAQTRLRGRLSWRESVRMAGAASVVGVAWTALTLAASPAFTFWMSPIFLGLLLSIPLVRWTSSSRLGVLLRQRGILLSPSEVTPVAELAATDPTREQRTVRDLSDRAGVSGTLGLQGWNGFQSTPESMINAERGLFDLRQGRPLLITARTFGRRADEPVGGVLLTPVESLDLFGLRRLRSLVKEPLHLVLTTHRLSAMGRAPSEFNAVPAGAYSLSLRPGVELDEIVELSFGAEAPARASTLDFGPAAPAEVAGLSLTRLGRLLPAVVAAPVWEPYSDALRSALASGAILQVGTEEVERFVLLSGAEVERITEAPVPLAEAAESRFVLFREAHGLQEHVAILVGDEDAWPDPVPVRIHSACLTGDLFGSLRCDCGEQLRGSMELFSERGGGLLLYLAQEGRGIGLRNKFRAYTLQERGLDTIDADNTLGFGADERRFDVAGKILQSLGISRVELLTNNPEKVRAMEEAGIEVVRRSPLHGTLNRHNLPYVRAKVHRAGHWLADMLSQPISDT